ncbi:hypothetical protein V6N11_052807 [Hibiscus sabdariffa]|uniref:Uncharacterized protein n=1 Tax=Hibiscus sabdariffa TaxID=183260 RepID=A0ABR2UB57_9ROSI
MEALLGHDSESSPSPTEVIRDYPIPELDSPTAVRNQIKVKATSLNYANYLQILGNYQDMPPLPFIPGSDYAGDPVCSYASFFVHDQSLLSVPRSQLV